MHLELSSVGDGEECDYELSPSILVSSLGLRFNYADNLPPAPPPPPLPPRRPSGAKKGKSSKIPMPPRSGFGAADAARPETKKRKPVLFLHLATSTMKCLHAGFMSSRDHALQSFVKSHVQAEHVSCLAWLVQNLDALVSKMDAGSKRESSLGCELANLGVDLMEMLQEMIVGGVIGPQYLQGVLLNELGLTAKCWPLRISPAALSLLGRVLVCRLGGEGHAAVPADGKNGDKNGDDRLAVNIWKGYASLLHENLIFCALLENLNFCALLKNFFVRSCITK